MNIKQIRYFVSVYRGASLSFAAKEQGVTVQAVSKAIANLEQELQGELFVRESRGVRPTPLGKRFFAKAELALQEFDLLEQFAHAYQISGDSVALRLGLVSLPFNRCDRACASIAAFIGRNLGTDTTVTLESPASGLSAMWDDALDALITVGSYDHPHADCLSIGTVAPSVLMAPGHPLVPRGAVRLDEMRPYPIAVVKGYDDFNDSIVAEYRRRRPDLRFVPIVFEDSDDFIFRKKGLALVAGIPALGALHAGAETRAVASQDALAVPICLVSPKTRKAPSYLLLERWLASELVLFGGKAPSPQKTWGAVG